MNAALDGKYPLGSHHDSGLLVEFPGDGVGWILTRLTYAGRETPFVRVAPQQA